MNEPLASLQWIVGTDPVAIHDLLTRCDAYTATSTAPAPKRNLGATRAYVEAGEVFALSDGVGLAASITVTWRPPFNHKLAVFPVAARPAYITRLCVAPEWLDRGAILGARCLRHAVERAAARGADAMRSEANPELKSMLALLTLAGFREHARGITEDGRHWALLEKRLKPADASHESSSR